jgi:2-amino-4-hydroxy-6-hydroxymethyldihydropteridine diphosphokinase
MAIAYIALGSNLQHPAQQVTHAFEVIAQLPQTTMLNQSSLYKTAPVGYDNQPDFVNAVAKVETTLLPETIMQHLLAIELQFGRERPFPNAPRILDLDLLLYDTVTMQTDLLTLPHPRMQSRGFVMLPLAEIAADLILPSGESVVELAKSFQQEDIQRIPEHTA